jgi:hypothetical protein
VRNEPCGTAETEEKTMTAADDLLASARAALSHLRKNGIASHTDDDVTKQLCVSFESLDTLLSGIGAILPAAWRTSKSDRP